VSYSGKEGERKTMRGITQRGFTKGIRCHLYKRVCVVVHKKGIQPLVGGEVLGKEGKTRTLKRNKLSRELSGGGEF